jgi:two-component system chemotaxis response regulator CheY
MIANTLRSNGCAHVLEAADPRTATPLLAPDVQLLVLEWAPAGEEALDFVRSLRADGANEHLRILLTSTRGAAGDVERAIAAHVDGYLLKPFSADALRHHVAALRDSEEDPAQAA